MTSHQRKLATIVSRLLEWYRSHARDLPWRRTTDPYAIWISEVMLQQTQVKTVIPYWERWMRDLPNIETLAKASPDRLHKLWEGLGYYRRVRSLQEAARLIMLRHAGAFPREFEDVLALPGIGRYTAGAICSIAFDQAYPILDGNVIRVLTRIFAITTPTDDAVTRERLWELAEELVQAAARVPGTLNQALMELGATICLPLEPGCPQCPVRRWCIARQTNATARLPNLPRRITSTPRQVFAFVIEADGKYLVRRRASGVVNGGLWEFPNVEVTQRAASPRAAADQVCHGLVCEAKPFLTVRHTITRFRFALRVFKARLPAERPRAGTWVSPLELRELAFPSAHRRIANALAA